MDYEKKERNWLGEEGRMALILCMCMYTHLYATRLLSSY